MIDGYKLSRQWFDFAWENPSRVTSNHTALYMWFIELNNRLGWVKEFQITAKESMGGMSTKTYKVYKKCLDDLIEWGFILLVKKSINQYQCNVIALVKISKAPTKAQDKAPTSALDKALLKAQPIFTKTTNQEQQTTNIENSPEFLEVWQAYVEVRRKKNMDTGEISTNQILMKLDTYAKDEPTQILILRQSVINNYHDIFPLRDNTPMVQGKKQIQTNETVQKLVREDNSWLDSGIL